MINTVVVALIDRTEDAHTTNRLAQRQTETGRDLLEEIRPAKMSDMPTLRLAIKRLRARTTMSPLPAPSWVIRRKEALGDIRIVCRMLDRIERENATAPGLLRVA